MKTHIPAASTAAKKRPARKPPGRTGSRQPAAKSLALPLPAVPTVWKIAAADMGFQSVGEWASAMLDIMSWPGNRFTLTLSDGQMKRWSKAGRSQDMNVADWVVHTLDAASDAVKPMKGGRP